MLNTQLPTLKTSRQGICMTCKWWKESERIDSPSWGFGANSKIGLCQVWQSGYAKVQLACGENTMETLYDFGCVQWETRDANDLHNSELQKYRNVWSQPYYRTPSLGLQLYQHARQWFPATFDDPIIDIGCGRGHVVNTWLDESHDAWGLDITDNCIDPPLRIKILSRMLVGPVWNADTWQGKRFSFGLCCDVMEHIPPEYVQQTLDVIMAHCDRALFKIACFHNVIGPSDLHMTVRAPEQWCTQLSYGTLEVHQMDDKDTCPYPYIVATVQRRT